MCASKSSRTRATTNSTSTSSVSTRQTRQSDSSDDNNNYSDDDDDDECNADANELGTDQDEDIIRAAEEAQESDLNEAVQSAELVVTVTDGEQKAASTALSKVSVALF
jgi:hypothetical protein